MEIPCQNSSNPEILSQSLDLLSYLVAGCWTHLAFDLLGIFNNFILLIVIYRLKWYRVPQYALIINQAIADMLTALMMGAESIYALNHYLNNTPTVTSQFQCLAIFVPISIIATNNQRMSVIVAIDRLINVLWPYKWAKLGLTYRLILIVLAFLSVLVEEGGWLAFVDENTCVVLCYDYLSYPDSWWDTVVTILDMVTSGFIVLAYILLPPLSGSIFSRLNCQFLVVALDNMEQRQQEIVKRVRQLSVLMITSYLLTVFVAFLLQDLTPVFGKNLNQATLIFIYPFTDVFVTLNTVLPLYLFTWREKSFRQELLSMLICKERLVENN